MTISSHRSAALTSGISLVIMAAVAGFSYGYVFTNLVVLNDSVETAKRISENSGLYIAGIAAWIAVLVLDVIVSFALFRFFKETNNSLSWISMVFRLVYSCFLGLGIYRLYCAIGAGDQTLQEIEGFLLIWGTGLIVFGMHLIVLGMLAYKAIVVPKIWGILLGTAGISYVICNGAKLLFGGTSEAVQLLENVLSLPMIVGELGFAIWLLVKTRDEGLKTMD